MYHFCGYYLSAPAGLIPVAGEGETRVFIISKLLLDDTLNLHVLIDGI